MTAHSELQQRVVCAGEICWEGHATSNTADYVRVVSTTAEKDGGGCDEVEREEGSGWLVRSQ